MLIWPYDHMTMCSSDHVIMWSCDHVIKLVFSFSNDLAHPQYVYDHVIECSCDRMSIWRVPPPKPSSSWEVDQMLINLLFPSSPRFDPKLINMLNLKSTCWLTVDQQVHFLNNKLINLHAQMMKLLNQLAKEKIILFLFIMMIW